jgi:hypothetical protein
VIGWNWDCSLPVDFKIERYGERGRECCGTRKGKMRKESCVMWLSPQVWYFYNPFRKFTTFLAFTLSFSD